ncbi:spore cortex biosynthesis protein YabQ [Gracilibacillus dipsosauri]|uniref:spore cortex biosynthesis protein YabQ n=1 Tax=Gracilibacillus dipsosauri TaxID=178340 RepID=UPI0024098E8C
MTLNTQFLTMFTMVAMGVYIGAAYYTFKRIEKWWADGIIRRYLLEFLFWIVQAFVFFYVLYQVNEGILRFYIFLAVFCGYAMFKALLEQAYSKGLELAIRIISHILRMVYAIIHWVLIKPITLLFTFVVVCLSWLYQLFFRLFSFIFRILFYPFILLWNYVKRFMPKMEKNYLYQFFRLFSKIKKKK